MKYLFFGIFILTLFEKGIAQPNSTFADHYTDYTSAVLVNAEAEYNSNAITNEFAKAFLFKQYLNNTYKNNVIKKLSGRNRFGLHQNYETGLWNRRKDKRNSLNTFYYIGIGYTENIFSNFTDDLFKIVFQGNKAYLGKTAVFDNFDYAQFNYQYIRIGFFKDTPLINNKFSYSVNLSLLKGQKNIDAHIDYGNLYTQQEGEYIKFDCKYSFQQTDTSTHNKLYSFNGTGSAMDIMLKYSFSEINYLKFSVKNAGAIHWYNVSDNYMVDTSLYYDGFDIPNIFQIEDSMANGVSQDSIIGSLTQNGDKSYTSFIPLTLLAEYHRNFNKTDLKVLLKYIFYPSYIPQLRVKINYMVSKNCLIGLNISGGGFGVIDFGLESKIHLGNGFIISCGTHNLDGLIFPAKATGMSIYLDIEKYF